MKKIILLISLFVVGCGITPQQQIELNQIMILCQQGNYHACRHHDYKKQAMESEANANNAVIFELLVLLTR